MLPPLALHVTVWSVALATVAVNCCAAFGATVALAGVTLTEIVRHSPWNSTWPAGHVTVTVAVPLTMRRTVAVTVTVPGFVGAVNRPTPSTVPSVAVQSKVVSPSLERALKAFVWPTSTLVAAGVTKTLGMHASSAEA